MVDQAGLLEATEAYGQRAPEHRRKLSSSVSLLIHALVLVSLVALPALLPPEVLPQQTPMVAFLAKPLAPPPPPPPPPPAPPLRVRAASLVKRLLDPVKLSTPTPAPTVIPEEPAAMGVGSGVGSADGVPGGQEGGVPGGVQGGVQGGVVGGLPDSPAPPPPRLDPVRVAPNAREAIPVVKVDPVYPEMALKERVQGVVILDVVVDREGTPISLRVVRSHAVFDAAALEAVKQWRWSAYLVEGQPVPFKVLVTVQFTLATKR